MGGNISLSIEGDGFNAFGVGNMDIISSDNNGYFSLNEEKRALKNEISISWQKEKEAHYKDINTEQFCSKISSSKKAITSLSIDEVINSRMKLRDVYSEINKEIDKKSEEIRIQEAAAREAEKQARYAGGWGPGKFTYGYCTWYVASRRLAPPGSGDAGTWLSAAQGSGWETGMEPRAGAIMVSWESYVGHVAYVESVNPDGTFLISEMNYGGWNTVTQRVLGVSSAPIIGFIY